MRQHSFRKGNLNMLGGLVNKSLDQLGLRHKIMEYQAVSKWKDVVGPQISASTVVQKVRDGIIFVCCKSSAWSNELCFLKKDIIKRLNKEVGGNVIRDIMFSAKGYRKAVEQVKKNNFNTKVRGLEAVEIDESQEEAANKVASTSANSDLAAKIQKAVLSSKRLEKVKISEGWKRCPKCNELHNGDYDVCDNCR